MKVASGIPDDIERRIVDLSLRHPDFGAKRLLPLLKDEEIDVSTSTVYRILRRHGQQTRSLRLLKIEAQRLAEAPSQLAAPPSKHAGPVSMPTDAPAPVVEAIKDKHPHPRSKPDAVVPSKSPKWSRSILFILNILLVALIGYLGLQAVYHFQQVMLGSEAVASIHISPVIEVVKPETTPRPLNDYRIIWDRNLFNVQKGKDLRPLKDMVLDHLTIATIAQKDLGLKLLGTVTADDNTLSLAIVHIQKTEEQKIFHEGDNAGNLYIKKILRNKVIITTDNGDVFLTMAPENFGKQPDLSPKRQIEMRSNPTLRILTG
jgi:hypothetical protein